jgi:hypothetical protein
MGRDAVTLLAAVLFSSESVACIYPDEGTMPLHRAITRVKLLPETEAWAKAEHKQGVVVQYAAARAYPRGARSLLLDGRSARRGQALAALLRHARRQVDVRRMRAS